jgi:hypothetical protein
VSAAVAGTLSAGLRGTLSSAVTDAVGPDDR